VMFGRVGSGRYLDLTRINRYYQVYTFTSIKHVKAVKVNSSLRKFQPIIFERYYWLMELKTLTLKTPIKNRILNLTRVTD
jgi:hypothetical protein